jgi:hypothetical protein
MLKQIPCFDKTSCWSMYTIRFGSTDEGWLVLQLYCLLLMSQGPPVKMFRMRTLIYFSANAHGKIPSAARSLCTYCSHPKVSCQEMESMIYNLNLLVIHQKGKIS